MYKLIASFLQSDEMIIFDQHIIELLFFFMFWIPLLASFQKSIYFVLLHSLQVAEKNSKLLKVSIVTLSIQFSSIITGRMYLLN